MPFLAKERRIFPAMDSQKRQYIRDGRAPIPEKEITSRIMSSICAKHTRPEIMLRKALRRVGFKDYKLYLQSVPGRPDISYLKKKLAIFVNGCYWHRCPKCKPSFPKSHKKFWRSKFQKNIARDKKKTKALQKLGWDVITVWECEIKKRINSIVKRITKHYAGIKK